MRPKHFSLVLAAIIAFSGCASSSKVTNYQGLTTPYGTPIARVRVSRLAFHLFGGLPLFGDASVQKATSDFFKEAKALGATKIHIDHSERQHFWFGLPPFTLFLTPVTSSVSGDALTDDTPIQALAKAQQNGTANPEKES
jgi:hypothetical protein